MDIILLNGVSSGPLRSTAGKKQLWKKTDSGDRRSLIDITEEQTVAKDSNVQSWDFAVILLSFCHYYFWFDFVSVCMSFHKTFNFNKTIVWKLQKKNTTYLSTFHMD